MVKTIIALVVFLHFFTSSSFGENISRKKLLKKAKTWMYQIQGLETDKQIEKLAGTSYPLLVIEPNFTHRDMTDFDINGMIKKLRNKKRLILAYIDIGQAESWRSYWKKNWKAPKHDKKGYPDFLVTVDPDGWEDCYPVAYWDKNWKKIWTGKNGLISKLAKKGFDGVYLDWVEAYDDETIIKNAEKEKINPALEMIKFIEEIGHSGRKITKDFLIIPQNAPFLIDFAPLRYAQAIDALAVEDTWFHGKADAKWESPDAGDIKSRHFGRWSTKNRLIQYKKFLNLGIPVFSVDYCVKKKNAEFVYRKARKYGLIPLVTRVDLSRITETP